MKIYKGCSIRGLRLADIGGNLLLDVTWYAAGKEGCWVTQNIQNGSEIIGLKCNTKESDSTIMRLACMIWTPKVTTTVH